MRLEAREFSIIATPSAKGLGAIRGQGCSAYYEKGIKTMTTAATGTSIEWARIDLKKVPHMVGGEVPGPKSQKMHRAAATIMKGYSSQVRLFPVVFERGFGCTLTDVDGKARCIPEIP